MGRVNSTIFSRPFVQPVISIGFVLPYCFPPCVLLSWNLCTTKWNTIFDKVSAAATVETNNRHHTTTTGQIRTEIRKSDPELQTTIWLDGDIARSRTKTTLLRKTKPRYNNNNDKENWPFLRAISFPWSLILYVCAVFAFLYSRRIGFMRAYKKRAHDYNPNDWQFFSFSCVICISYYILSMLPVRFNCS